MHKRLIYAIRLGECLPIDFCATRHKDLIFSVSTKKRISEVVHYDYAVMVKIDIPGQDDIASIGEGLADGFERLSAHHDGVSRCERFEACQIGGKVPRKRAATADDTILGHGENERNRHCQVRVVR